MDILNGIKWQTAGMKAKERKSIDSAIKTVLMEESQQSFPLLANGPREDDPRTRNSRKPYWRQFKNIWHQARATADRETFLHWEATFPGVWQGWTNADRQGGFDAVIGNPPWDRIKLQEVEWFSSRYPEIALVPVSVKPMDRYAEACSGHWW